MIAPEVWRAYSLHKVTVKGPTWRDGWCKPRCKATVPHPIAIGPALAESETIEVFWVIWQPFAEEVQPFEALAPSK
jgi:hypothetical protein